MYHLVWRTDILLNVLINSLAVCSNGVLQFIDVKDSAEIWTIGTYEHKVTQVGLSTL